MFTFSGVYVSANAQQLLKMLLTCTENSVNTHIYLNNVNDSETETNLCLRFMVVYVFASALYLTG